MTVDEQAITVTGTLQQQAWRDLVLPPVEQVRPGLWSVPTPFPHSPLRYVLAYLIETPAGPALVDTGWPSAEAWDGLVAGLRQTGHDVADVVAVPVPHGHADHFGPARRVRDASGDGVGLPWLGGTFELVKDPLGLLERMGHEYGAISEMRYWRGGRILLNSPELIEQVLVVQHQKFIKGVLLRLTAQRLLGQGLLTSEGELWRRQRRARRAPLLHRRRAAA